MASHIFHSCFHVCYVTGNVAQQSFLALTALVCVPPLISKTDQRFQEAQLVVSYELKELALTLF